MPLTPQHRSRLIALIFNVYQTFEPSKGVEFGLNQEVVMSVLTSLVGPVGSELTSKQLEELMCEADLAQYCLEELSLDWETTAYFTALNDLELYSSYLQRV